MAGQQPVSSSTDPTGAETQREKKARAQGLEPQPTEPESVVLPITPRPKRFQYFTTLPTWAEVRPPGRKDRSSIHLHIFSGKRWTLQVVDDGFDHLLESPKSGYSSTNAGKRWVS